MISKPSRAMNGRRPCVAVVSLALILTTRLGWATPPVSDAARHFARGLEFAQESEFDEASIEFQRAYRISPEYSVLYNLGEAYVGMGKPVEAFDTLSRYLSDGGVKVGATRRAEVEAELQRQRARIATVSINIEPEAATVSVDGRELERSEVARPLRIGVGSHRFVAKLDGYESNEQSLQLAGEDARTVELRLVPVPQTQTAAASAPALPPRALPARVPPRVAHAPASQASSPQQTVGVVVAGAGVIALGVGTAFGISARGKASQRDSIARACGAHCTVDDVARASALQHDAASSARVANYGFAGGALVVLTGLGVWLSAPSNSNRSVRVSVAWSELAACSLQAEGTW